MRELKDIISESLLDDGDEIMDEITDAIHEDIKKWIFDNYKVIKSSVKILKKPNNDGKFIVNANHAIFNSNSDTLTNGLFVWGKIKNQFYCARSGLKNLEGAPRVVGGNFNCCDCDSLKDLKGAPRKVGGDFDCSNCDSLKSLEGAPYEVGKDFSCKDCGTQFTIDDVKKLCNVKKYIYTQNNENTKRIYK